MMKKTFIVVIRDFVCVEVHIYFFSMLLAVTLFVCLCRGSHSFNVVVGRFVLSSRILSFNVLLSIFNQSCLDHIFQYIYV
jgi:hypothetical protein